MTAHPDVDPYAELDPPDERTMRERMLAGDLYRGDAEILQGIDRAQELMETHEKLARTDPEGATAALRELLGHMGEGVWIRPPFKVDYGSNIFIGDRSWANYGLIALDPARITIGSDVLIGPNVQLLTPTHPIDADLRRAKWEAAEPITIGDNVWIGGGAIVCPGVTVGDNAVIGAGAVVVKDIPANAVAVGNPARVVRVVEPGEARPDPARV
ncbi:sugar O-acetyltransferase [Demequina sp. B12]|uniref:sugar O-acetyltransferase n=1 Tax=Demequina sp. B12 TaxID=2992757 RepID=UPI00237BDF32|nr:sugar O-acetyltransferase [Demequina sp. B12]MDE0573516.1 sugar O-acetyltransferase [Demequina sp. B12]